MQPPDAELRLRYLRPLTVAIAGSVLAEAAIFVVWGIILYLGGSLLTKFLWTIVFCGMGMGSALGSILALFVVDRVDGWVAVAITSLLSAAVLGLGCNVLCYQLDTHYFHFFGGSDSPVLFIGSGIVMATVGGAAGGWLMFTRRGRRCLTRLGL